jgi:hypothetical protein
VGIRETLNKNQKVALPILIGVVAIAGFLAIKGIKEYLWPPKPEFKPPKGWYTTDEGATWFEGDYYGIAPIEHQGKQAVRVYLFKCGQDGQKFAGYLERFSKKGKEEIEKRDPKQRGGMMEEWESEKFVKKPGAGERWYKFGDSQYEQIMTIKCPDGSFALSADMD